MKLPEKARLILEKFSPSEAEIIIRFLEEYLKKPGRPKDPTSLNQQSAKLGVSRQALWQRKKRESENP